VPAGHHGPSIRLREADLLPAGALLAIGVALVLVYALDVRRHFHQLFFSGFQWA